MSSILSFSELIGESSLITWMVYYQDMLSLNSMFLRAQENCSDSQQYQEYILSKTRVISNTLKGLRHDKNTALEEDFIVRKNLLYSLGQKNDFLMAPACFTYIIS